MTHIKVDSQGKMDLLELSHLLFTDYRRVQRRITTPTTALRLRSASLSGVRPRPVHINTRLRRELMTPNSFTSQGTTCEWFRVTPPPQPRCLYGRPVTTPTPLS